MFVSPEHGAWFLVAVFRNSCLASVLLDIADDADDPPTGQLEVCSPKIVICL